MRYCEKEVITRDNYSMHYEVKVVTKYRLKTSYKKQGKTFKQDKTFSSICGRDEAYHSAKAKYGHFKSYKVKVWQEYFEIRESVITDNRSQETEKSFDNILF